MRAQTVQAPGRSRRVRPDRGARLQPDVRDDDRPGEGVGLDRLPAPGDGAGHLHQLQERAAVRAQEAAVRHRAGRQVVPQRDHAGQLHLPHARVRADGDGVLRAAGRGAAVVRALARASASAGTSDLGIRPDHLRLRAHDADELSHYSSGTSDVEYLFPIGWSELEGIANRGDFDLTQHAEFSGREARVLRPGQRRALRAARDRAGGRRRPRDARVPRRRLRRGSRASRRGERARTVLRLHPRLAPVKVAVLPLVQQGRPAGARARGRTTRCAGACRPSTTRAARSASATAARTRSARRCASRSTTRALEDRTVTVRDRDSLAQERVPIDELAGPARARDSHAPWRSPKL